ncbi:uncharacterized protein LOC110465494 [Mizuhopecten yessoensis]|uniref:Teratocarcinoma-derived growth factor n=1 Tax=Mizuhopecten yessoensis TaxID=6573 RepID=A0A210PRI2_MIZYE|nr:uncharacterized protein LOC110465494 [Mizuhopecten yessoensis]OWF39099.1 Teratocarcinoma-derived growth factor [Mizuhopecten yessoensis]
MEFKNAIIMCLQVIIAINSMVGGTYITDNEKNKVTLKKKNGQAKPLNEAGQSSPQHNEVERISLLGNGATDNTVKTGNCCKNGGRCILNNFCHCRKNFYGRYCQYEYKNRSCGELKSGHFIRSDCDLCRCFDGYMYCIPRIYPGCEDEGLVDHSKKIDPFKGKDIEIIPDVIDGKSMNLRTFDTDKDYAYYYNDYDGTDSSMASHLTGSYVTIVILLPVLVFCGIGVFEVY